MILSIFGFACLSLAAYFFYSAYRNIKVVEYLNTKRCKPKVTEHFSSVEEAKDFLKENYLDEDGNRKNCESIRLTSLEGQQTIVEVF